MIALTMNENPDDIACRCGEGYDEHYEGGLCLGRDPDSGEPCPCRVFTPEPEAEPVPSWPTTKPAPGVPRWQDWRSEYDAISVDAEPRTEFL